MSVFGVAEGAPVHLDLKEFREEVMSYQSMRTTDITHPGGDGYEVNSLPQHHPVSPTCLSPLLCVRDTVITGGVSR